LNSLLNGISVLASHGNMGLIRNPQNLRVLGQAPKLSQKLGQKCLYPSQKERGVTEEVHMVWILSERKRAMSDADPRGF